MNADNPLSLSRTSLEALLRNGGRWQRSLYNFVHNHFSYEIQFDKGRVRPIAIRKYTFRRKRGWEGDT
jgi:hypothetical protein